jgi:hypothetical protein
MRCVRCCPRCWPAGGHSSARRRRPSPPARANPARQGEARRGEARRGKAGRGEAGGEVRAEVRAERRDLDERCCRAMMRVLLQNITQLLFSSKSLCQHLHLSTMHKCADLRVGPGCFTSFSHPFPNAQYAVRTSTAEIHVNRTATEATQSTRTRPWKRMRNFMGLTSSWKCLTT